MLLEPSRGPREIDPRSISGRTRNFKSAKQLPLSQCTCVGTYVLGNQLCLELSRGCGTSWNKSRCCSEGVRPSCMFAAYCRRGGFGFETGASVWWTCMWCEEMIMTRFVVHRHVALWSCYIQHYTAYKYGSITIVLMRVVKRRWTTYILLPSLTNIK